MPSPTCRQRSARGAKEIWTTARRMVKYLLWSVGLFAIPLFTLQFIRVLATEPLFVGRAVWTVAITTAFGVVLSVYKAVAAHAADFVGRANGQSKQSAPEVKSANKLVTEELWTELKRAGDIGGRTLVATLLWATFYWIAKNLAEVVVNDGSFVITDIREQYLDPALIVGPMLGLLVWWVDVVWREAKDSVKRRSFRLQAGSGKPDFWFFFIVTIVGLPFLAFWASTYLVR